MRSSCSDPRGLEEQTPSRGPGRPAASHKCGCRESSVRAPRSRNASGSRQTSGPELRARQQRGPASAGDIRIRRIAHSSAMGTQSRWPGRAPRAGAQSQPVVMLCAAEAVHGWPARPRQASRTPPSARRRPARTRRRRRLVRARRWRRGAAAPARARLRSDSSIAAFSSGAVGALHAARRACASTGACRMTAPSVRGVAAHRARRLQRRW